MCWRRHVARMVGIRVIHLQEIRPPSPLHWPWIKDRRVGDIVALIDATLAQARRVSSNSAITSAPVTATAAAPSGSAVFSSPTVKRPVNSRRVDHAPELRALFLFRRAPLERWKGRWRFGITWIGDHVMDHLVANSKAIPSGDRVILAMVPSDACGR